jgi:hypothetical protein
MHLAISCIASEAAEIDEIATGERATRLLQAAAGHEITEVDRYEAEALDRALDEFGRLGVIPGDEDDAAAMGNLRVNLRRMPLTIRPAREQA